MIFSIGFNSNKLNFGKSHTFSVVCKLPIDYCVLQNERFVFKLKSVFTEFIKLY